MLTLQQIGSFEENGYLKLDRLLAPEEVESLKECLDELLEGRLIG